MTDNNDEAINAVEILRSVMEGIEAQPFNLIHALMGVIFETANEHKIDNQSLIACFKDGLQRYEEI